MTLQSDGKGRGPRRPLSVGPLRSGSPGLGPGLWLHRSASRLVFCAAAVVGGLHGTAQGWQGPVLPRHGPRQVLGETAWELPGQGRNAGQVAQLRVLHVHCGCISHTCLAVRLRA